MNPDPTSWQTVLLGYGPLGAFAVIATVAVGWGVRELWKVWKPHIIAKQTLELAKEQRQCDLYETLRASEGPKLEFQRQIIKLVETVHSSQGVHAADCHDTHRDVKKIVKHLGIE